MPLQICHGQGEFMLRASESIRARSLVVTTCARKPKVPGSSSAASYVQG